MKTVIHILFIIMLFFPDGFSLSPKSSANQKKTKKYVLISHPEHKEIGIPSNLDPKTENYIREWIHSKNTEEIISGLRILSSCTTIKGEKNGCYESIFPNKWRKWFIKVIEGFYSGTDFLQMSLLFKDFQIEPDFLLEAFRRIIYVFNAENLLEEIYNIIEQSAYYSDFINFLYDKGIEGEKRGGYLLSITQFDCEEMLFFNTLPIHDRSIKSFDSILNSDETHEDHKGQLILALSRQYLKLSDEGFKSDLIKLIIPFLDGGFVLSHKTLIKARLGIGLDQDDENFIQEMMDNSQIKAQTRADLLEIGLLRKQKWSDKEILNYYKNEINRETKFMAMPRMTRLLLEHGFSMEMIQDIIDDYITISLKDGESMMNVLTLKLIFTLHQNHGIESILKYKEFIFDSYHMGKKKRNDTIVNYARLCMVPILQEEVKSALSSTEKLDCSV